MGARQASASPPGTGDRRPDADEDRDAAGTALEALLFATAPAADGGPAAALELSSTTLLGRLLGQLESLGARRAWVVTRPRWREAVEAAAARSGVDVTVVTAEGMSDDLQTTAEIAAGGNGPLLVMEAHLVTHREALAGLARDPRILSGVLSTGSPERADRSFPIRSLRRHIVSAASPYHRVGRPSGYFLGVMKLDARDRAQLGAASRRLAELASEPRPQAWEDELDRKFAEWEPLEVDPDVAFRRRAAAEDAVSLLLVGLVRNEVDLFPSNVRGFFYARPLSTSEAERAAEELRGYDEDKVLLDSAVKANDGAFTTFLVSPYSKYLARFAARRGWTPNAVSAASLAIGAGAAASFALGSRASLIVGAVLLQISFTVDCVDGQLARYTRTFSTLGGWLDSVFDRAKEYLVYAGLALGASRGFEDDVWLLAALALTLQTVRHTSDFAYVAGQRRATAAKRPPPLDRPEDGEESAANAKPIAVPEAAEGEPTPRGRLAVAQSFRQSSWARWANRIVRLPIGERFALISLTAAIWNPRVTFVALLVWGGAAAAYAFTGRILMSYAVPRRILRLVTR